MCILSQSPTETTQPYQIKNYVSQLETGVGSILTCGRPTSKMTPVIPISWYLCSCIILSPWVRAGPSDRVSFLWLGYKRSFVFLADALYWSLRWSQLLYRRDPRDKELTTASNKRGIKVLSPNRGTDSCPNHVGLKADPSPNWAFGWDHTAFVDIWLQPCERPWSRGPS